ncbi:MAG: rhamnulokinase, partial [Bacteroidales bacterium]|nr:rhamnulokinase [Bacteroidales bacterium]
MKEAYLAADFGGGSGRVIVGWINDGRIELKEIHRFRNRQIFMGNHLYWDALALFEDMKQGIKKAVDEGYYIKSIGIDTWGVDFALIDRRGNLLQNPVCYRDKRTESVFNGDFTSRDKQKIYHSSGLQSMNINTLYQLCSLQKECPEIFDYADKLLFMPDLFSYYLTGQAFNEYTIASTSDLLSAQNRDWNFDLIESLYLKKEMFCRIVKPGKERFLIKEDVRKELNLPDDCALVPIASHDTQSAVYSLQNKTQNDAFLSSGTWSLLGCEINEPILTDDAFAKGFSNEGSVNDKICFLQNITGLWTLQRLIAQWQTRGEDTDLTLLNTLAEKSDFDTVVDVDDNIFQAPDNMEQAFEMYCSSHGLQSPKTKGEYVRCIFLSLAERYAKGINEMNKLLPEKIERLTVMGGGSNSELLNALTADKCGIKVLKGESEATAVGNILL